MNGNQTHGAPLSRRALLLTGAVTLTGCVEPARDSGQARPRTSSSPPPPPSPPPPSPPAAAPTYRPPAGDALPDFKQTAGRFVQSVATYDATDVPPVAAASPDFIGSSTDLVAAAAPLLQPDRWSRTEIEFVQFGGLTPVSPQARSGVAIVVARQVLSAPSGETTVVRRVLDVRLVQRQGSWRVDALASAGGTPVAAPLDLPEASSALLRDVRVDLPDSARWDVYSGQISAALVDVLARLAEIAPLRATVLRTGHPERVVDGRKAPPVSAHWLGRAVDLNALNGTPIASAAPADLRRFVAAAAALPQVSQIGAPPGFDLDGRGSRRYFTNLVHADHLHIAVRNANG